MIGIYQFADWCGTAIQFSLVAGLTVVIIAVILLAVCSFLAFLFGSFK